MCGCGVGSVPEIDGRIHHFGARGLYNGGLLLGDRESGSYWQHLTGTCVYGPRRGHQLELFPLVHMTAGQALRAYPEARVAVSPPSFKQWAITRAQEGVLALLRGRLPPGFSRTMGAEDLRRPRMERGLVVWTAGAARFYPLEALRRSGDALIDELDGRRWLIYVDPATGRPACLRTDAATFAWRDGALELGTGEIVRGGVVYGAAGTPQAADRPMHSLTCWYVFAFAFPGGEIYAR